MKRSARPLLHSIVNELFKDAKLSFWTSLFVHLASNLQVIYLILQPTLNASFGFDLKAFKPVRFAASYAVGFDIFDPPQTEAIIQVVWYTIAVYLLSLTTLILNIIIKCFKKANIPSSASNILKLVYFLHSKLLFCPIQYFLVWVIISYGQCSTLEVTGTIQCGLPYFILSLVLAFINAVISIVKEMFTFQLKKPKDAFAVKNNLFFQTMLLHKVLLIVLLIALKEEKLVLSISNFIFPLIYCYNILSSLPFYNIFFLKLSMVFSVCHLAFTFVLMIISFGIDQKYTETLIVVLAITLIRLSLVYIDYRLKKIMRLEFKTPQEAAHILVLLKDSTAHYSNITKLEDKYLEGSFYLYGLLTSHNVDASKLKEFETMSEYNYQLYSAVMRKLNEILKVYPKSELLILLMAQIYIKKLRNTAKAITILTQFEAGGFSMRAHNAVKKIYHKLERIYCKIHSDEELELLKYFKQRDNANKLKEMIQEEILKHIRVWKELASDLINVKLVADIAEEIDVLHNRSSKLWNEVQRTLDKNFLAPIVMYAAYLDIVRSHTHAARKMMRKYNEIKKNKNVEKNVLSPFNENVAVILGSIEIENAGIVKDASSSVQTIFNIARENLVGQKIEIVLPRPIAKKHEILIKRFVRQNKHDFNRQFDTYGKTTDGHFFPVEVKSKIYPYINQGLNIISLVRKLRDREVLIILDQHGNITECSEDLYDIFNLTKKDLDVVKGVDLCPELKDIENAYQLLYGMGKEWISLYKDESKISMTDDKLDGSESKLRSGEFKKIDYSIKDQTPMNDKLERNSEMWMSQNMSTIQETKGSQYGGIKPKILQTLAPFAPQQNPAIFITNPIQKLNSEQMHNQIKLEAEETCRMCLKGVKLIFYPKSQGRELSSKDKIEFKVVIMPYVLDGELFKVLKFKKVYFEENTYLTRESTTPYFVQPKITTEMSQDGFPEEFPTANERSLKSLQDHSVEEKVLPVVTRESKNRSKLEKLQKILVKNVNNDSFGQDPDDEQEIFFKLAAKGINDDTSSLRYSHKETRIVKALHELFQKSTMRPVTKIAVLTVYLAMLVVLFLASLDFIFSSKSFDQMKDGAMIVNTASYRIRESLLAWEHMLIIYARSLKIRPISSIVQTSQATIRDSTTEMLQRNRELQDRLQLSADNELIETFFADSVSLWMPYQDRTFDSSNVSTFTASKVIAQKNLFVANYDKSVLLLKENEDVLFMLNNTCNDLLVRSEDQVLKAEQIINNVIQTNQTLVVILLSLEMIALVFVGISLLSVARVITNSYRKLFKVLGRIHQDNYSQRLAELNAIYDCLNKNIEMKDFSIKIEGYSDITNRTAKKNAKHKINTRYREDKFFLKDLIVYASKVLLVGLFLILIIASVFLVSFLTADATFNTLERYNQRLSIAHQLGYTFDMILGAFYFTIIFQNQTRFLVRFNPPSVELDNSLEFLSLANDRLLAILQDPKEGITDPILENFLKTDACRFLDSSIDAKCDLVTKSKSLGLLGLNTKYYQSNYNWASKYRQNPTFDYAAEILVLYANEIINDIDVLPEVYEFLRSYLLKAFSDKIEDQKLQSLKVFVIILVCLLVSTFTIQMLTIKKFKDIDIGIRKILKTIPFNVIQENKLFGSYLKAEFTKELESIKQFV